MVRIITDKSDYQKHVDLETTFRNTIGTKHIMLFEQPITLYDDPWMWHLHIKLSNACNAKCSFCVEQGDETKNNPTKLLENLDLMLREMKKKGVLHSVSVTGGEPTIYPYFHEVCLILQKYDIPFVTLNTNGALVHKYLKIIDETFHFIDISRHRLTDSANNSVFKTTVPSIADLQLIRGALTKCKMRIQCVLDTNTSIEFFKSFCDVYAFADDLSFRRLMKLEQQTYNIDEEGYRRLLDYCLENYTFRQQVIQDYYVYEIYNNGQTDITFSYSDMKLLLQQEHNEDDNKVREFILHPNGIVSKSWKQTNIILR